MDNARTDPWNIDKDFPLGARVYAKKPSGICSLGEPGLVVEEYSLGGRQGRTLLFKSGNYDGFSIEDLNVFIVPEGTVDKACSCYAFSNVGRLAQDHQKKLFDFSAFAPYSNFLSLSEKEILNQSIPSSTGPRANKSI